MTNGSRKDWSKARQVAREQLDWLLSKTGGQFKQQDLAARMNMTPSTLSRILSGDLEHSPSPVVCALIGYVWRERRRELRLPDDDLSGLRDDDGEPVAVAA